jgi:L-lactate permease
VEGRIESGTVPAVLGPELADLLAALITVVAVIGLLSFWRPSSEWHFGNLLTPAPGFRPSG